MSTKIRFGNRIVQLPGTYSRIISGQNNPPRDLDYGKLLIIDNSNFSSSLAGTGMLGGAGVNGELASGKSAVYSLKDINSFRDFCGGNWWGKAAEGLFNPDGRGNGVSEIFVVKPATTTASKLSFLATGGGAAGGLFQLKTRDESLEANGVSNETRSQSTVTVTAAGATTNKITIKVSGVTVAEYTNLNSDNIATVVAGLADDMALRGICEVVTEVSPALVFKAPKGQGSATVTPSITVTGTATATTVAFTGGVDGNNLVSGYAYAIETATLDPTKWVMKIWRGTFKGLHTDGFAYDEIASADSRPILLAQSVEFNNMATLINWAKADTELGKLFKLADTSVVTGLGTVTAADILPLKSYQPSIGGTATYDSIDDALDAVKDLNYNYILTTSSTANPTSDATILKIVDHISIASEAKYDKYLMIAGADTNINTTVGYAQSFDSERVNIVHGSIKKTSRIVADGFRTWGALYHAAYYVGRLLGIAPETPLTYKSFDIDGVTDELNENQQLLADSEGVLVTIWDADFGKFINLHDINTLQNNDFVLNNDGTSHLIQIERIKSQLNKELAINAKLDLLSDPNGVNRSSLTEEDAIVWTKTYLQRKLGTLIVDYRNVTAYTVEDVIFVDYEASPNTEIKSIFFTGRLYL